MADADMTAAAVPDRIFEFGLAGDWTPFGATASSDPRRLRVRGRDDLRRLFSRDEKRERRRFSAASSTTVLLRLHCKKNSRK